MKYLELNSDGALINKSDKAIVYIPKYYFDSNMATEYGNYIGAFGVFYTEFYVGNTCEVYSFNIPVAVEISFDEAGSGTKKFKDDEEEEYRTFTVPKDGLFIRQTVVAKSGQNTIDFLNFLTEGKTPESIQYENILSLFKESAKFGGVGLGVQSITVELVVSEICRDKSDMSQPFRMKAGKFGSNNPLHKYEPVKIKEIPSLTSTWSGLGFEDINNAMMTGVIDGKTGKKQHKTPTEDLLYM